MDNAVYFWDSRSSTDTIHPISPTKVFELSIHPLYVLEHGSGQVLVFSDLFQEVVLPTEPHHPRPTTK